MTAGERAEIHGLKFSWATVGHRRPPLPHRGTSKVSCLPMATHETCWFDAHLDLAMMAALGRDMAAQPAEAGGPDLPASITLPSLAAGCVRTCLGTIFTEAGGSDRRIGYPHGDAHAAFTVGTRQLQIYRQWADAGWCRLPTATVSATVKVTVPCAAQGLRVGILIEGADIIREPVELAWWAGYGVVAVGLAWWTASRYAGGNGTPPGDPRTGITPLGRELVAEMDRLGLVHDASHLSDRAFADLLEATGRTVIASHSNCRALMGDVGNQRHLTDGQIKAIAGRGGVIGLNLYSRFLDAGCDKGGRTSIATALRHVEHICELTGSRDHVGLGTDADGGFSAARLPEGIDTPSDYGKLCEGLRGMGWNDEAVSKFVTRNFARVFPGLLGLD